MKEKMKNYYFYYYYIYIYISRYNAKKRIRCNIYNRSHNHRCRGAVFPDWMWYDEENKCYTGPQFAYIRMIRCINIVAEGIIYTLRQRVSRRGGIQQGSDSEMSSASIVVATVVFQSCSAGVPYASTISDTVVGRGVHWVADLARNWRISRPLGTRKLREVQSATTFFSPAMCPTVIKQWWCTCR